MNSRVPVPTLDYPFQTVSEEVFSEVRPTQPPARIPNKPPQRRKCMDASSNAEVLKRYVKAFERKDWEAATAFWSDEITRSPWSRSGQCAGSVSWSSNG